MLCKGVLHALFGGTFDPIHYGHLWVAKALAIEIGINCVTILPNHIPPHRQQPKANATQRLKMVKLAITDNALFSVDDRELNRKAPSYTIQTLADLRKECGTTLPLAFILGKDSLLTLTTWYCWKSLLDFCHLLVLARPGYPDHLLNELVPNRWLERHRVTDAIQLRKKSHGYIYLSNTPEIDISSSKIRHRSYQGLKYNDLLPGSVRRYIESQDLYSCE